MESEGCGKLAQIRERNSGMKVSRRITSGPLDAKIAFVGELLGVEEIRQKRPQVGPGGEEFNRMLAAAFLIKEQRVGQGHWKWMQQAFKERESKFYITNVFHCMGTVEDWCRSKAEVVEEYKQERLRLMRDYPSFSWPSIYLWPFIGKAGKYLRPKYLDVLPKLQEEINSLPSCNLVVALGTVALWALAGQTGVMKVRGTPLLGTLIKQKILPTFNPAYILRTWTDRPILIADLIKIREEGKTSELVLPSREVWLVPTLEDMDRFYKEFFPSVEYVGIDAEWAHDQIEMVGFAIAENRAIVVPFVDYLSEGYSYWKTQAEEVAAVRWCRKILMDKRIKKVAHNSLADVQVLWQKWGCPTYNCCDDSMIAHHALQPGMKKGLAFLASLYTKEASWKWLRAYDSKGE